MAVAGTGFAPAAGVTYPIDPDSHGRRANRRRSVAGPIEDHRLSCQTWKGKKYKFITTEYTGSVRRSLLITSCALAAVLVRSHHGDSAAGFAILGADDTSRGTRQGPLAAQLRRWNTRGFAYAVIGGNAVATWVGRVDQSAVRFTQDVDLLILRSDLDATKAALETAGFIYRHVASVDLFLDGPDAKARDAVHVIFAGEKVCPDYALPAPDVIESEPAETFRVLRLDAFVRMKLTSFRDKDRTHLRD